MQLLLAGEMFPTCGLATPATTPPLAASRAECGHGIEKTCAYHLNTPTEDVALLGWHKSLRKEEGRRPQSLHAEPPKRSRHHELLPTVRVCTLYSSEYT